MYRCVLVNPLTTRMKPDKKLAFGFFHTNILRLAFQAIREKGDLVSKETVCCVGAKLKH